MLVSYSYIHEVLNTSRIEQQKNPEVSVSSTTPYLDEELKQYLEVGARDLRYLLSEEICVDDDEDTKCVEPNDYCKIPLLPVIDTEYSGSGMPPTRPTFPTTHSTDIPTVDERNPSKETTPPTTSTMFSATTPREWATTAPTVESTTDGPTTGGSASSIRYSLYMILLLLVVAILLL